jgi:hypothetical protein
VVPKKIKIEVISIKLYSGGKLGFLYVSEMENMTKARHCSGKIQAEKHYYVS